jgi:SAM-dependent methyltransferase
VKTSCDDPNQSVVEGVKEYYGETLRSTKDLKTSACTACEKPHAEIQKIIGRIPKQVVEKFYGCGFPTPLGIEGMRVLDLGCGSGRDCYIAAALVGEQGHVTGVDMTDQQLQTARGNAEEYATKQLGYRQSNMTFLKGYIEDLTGLGIQESSVDLIISNCVVNLSVNKEKVLDQLHKVLATGGEFQFSDVFCNRILPEQIKKHKVLVGECLGGAMEVNEFLQLADKTGFIEPQMLSKTEIEVHDPELKALLGDAQFWSITYRLFKLPKEGGANMPTTQVQATYNGSFDATTDSYKVNSDLTLKVGKEERVEGPAADILSRAWIKKFFEITPLAQEPKENSSDPPKAVVTSGCGPNSGCCG